MLRKHFFRIAFVVLVVLNISCDIYSQPVQGEPAQTVLPVDKYPVTRPVLPSIEPTNIAIAASPVVTDTLAARKKVYIPTISSPVRGFFVSPKGSSRGDGSISKPWDLKTALDHPSKVKPGDTIWLRGGTYGDGGHTIFNSKLEGAAGNPITVRAYPGERVTIDGCFMIYGSWSTFWGLEVTNSRAKRTSQEAGSHPDDIPQGNGFNVLGSHNQFINNIVHEQSTGFGFWKEAVDSELYGNVTYNNGWEGPDRTHGYGIYSQNETGMKRIRDNISFNNFGWYTLHIYGESVRLQGYEIDGNIFFNGEMVLGGLLPAAGISFTHNYLFRNQARFGYKNQSNLDLTVRNNTFWADEGSTLEIRWWKDLNVTGNLVLNESDRLVDFQYPDGSYDARWNDNTFYGARTDSFLVEEQAKTWSAWRSQTGFDGNSSFSVGMPSGVDVYVRPNEYEPKRGHIIVYNWDRQDTVTVDIGDLGLKPGDLYVLHNAQNYFEESISGVYDGGPIKIPMKGWSITVPVGWNEPLQPTTFPLFGVFILTGEK